MPPKKQENKTTVHLVIQRYRWCKILLNEVEWRSVGIHAPGDESLLSSSSEHDQGRHHCGWLVYTSFAEGCNPETIQKAALTLFQMPLGTWGQWEERGSSSNSNSGGNGGRPQSLKAMMEQYHQEQGNPTCNTSGDNNNNTRLSVVLCPQANLVSKVKQNGKSVQYHGQCDKSTSEQLFVYLGFALQALLLEYQCELRGEPLPESLLQWKQQQQPPQQTIVLDEELSSSSVAALPSWCDALNLVTVVMGSFGKRQGLEFSSDMGPFCHTVQI